MVYFGFIVNRACFEWLLCGQFLLKQTNWVHRGVDSCNAVAGNVL